MKVFWLRLYPKDPATGLEVPYLFTTRNHPQATNIEAGKVYLPFMESYPRLEISVFQGEFTGRAEVKCDNISISLGSVDLVQWPNLVWDGARAELLKGFDNTATIAAATMIFTGLVDKAPNFDQDSVGISLIDFGGNLEKEFLTAKYAGTGGVEGPIGLKGVFKPLALGKPKGIAPILIDSAHVVFQYSAYAETIGVQSLWENGLSFGAKTATIAYQGSIVATYNALVAQALTVGQWADAPSIGMFRLGGEPAQGGVITADVYGIRNGSGGPLISTISDCLNYLFGVAGEGARINTPNLTAFQTATGGQTISDYWTDQETIKEIVERYLQSVGAFYFYDTTGLVKFSVIRMVAPTYTLSTLGNVEPVVEEIGVLPVSAPHKELRMGVDKNFRVHAINEISDALLVKVNQAQATADSAQEAADAAAADVVDIETSMNQIGADGVLSRVEKQTAIVDRANLENEKADIFARADGYGITTPKSDYITSLAALDTYLAGLSPTWNNTAVDTPIVRATWTSKWTATYLNRSLLLNEIAERAVMADAFIGQGDLSLVDVVTPAQVSTDMWDLQNGILDPNFSSAQFGGTTYWSMSSGMTINTGAEAVALGVIRAVKSNVGNGTTSQSTDQLVQRSPSTGFSSVHGNQSYRYTVRIWSKAGFTGMAQVQINYYDQSGTVISGAGGVTNLTDYRTVANTADNIQDYDKIYTAPANAQYSRMLVNIFYSTTLNNAQYCVAGRPAAVVATDSGQIADNAVTATKWSPSDALNLIADPLFADTKVWNAPGGFSSDVNVTDPAKLATTKAAIATVVGNANGAVILGYNSVAYYERITLSRTVRVTFEVMAYYTAGYTGRLTFNAFATNETGGTVLTSPVNGTDFRTVAAVADTIETLRVTLDVPVSSSRLRFSVTQGKSGTLPDAGMVYLASPRMTRHSDFGTEVWGLEKPADYAGTSLTGFGQGTDAALMVTQGNKWYRGSGAGWDASIVSYEAFSDSVAAQWSFTAATTMAGLTVAAAIDNTNAYSALDYAFYYQSGQIIIYESNVNRGVFKPSATGSEVLAITYDGTRIRYWIDGVVVRTVATTAGRAFKFMMTPNLTGSGVKNILWMQGSIQPDINTNIMDGNGGVYVTVPRNEIRTPLGIAAGFNGQGGLSLLDRARLGFHLYRADDTTLVNELDALNLYNRTTALSAQPLFFNQNFDMVEPGSSPARPQGVLPSGSGLAESYTTIGYESNTLGGDLSIGQGNTSSTYRIWFPMWRVNRRATYRVRGRVKATGAGTGFSAYFIELDSEPSSTANFIWYVSGSTWAGSAQAVQGTRDRISGTGTALTGGSGIFNAPVTASYQNFDAQLVPTSTAKYMGLTIIRHGGLGKELQLAEIIIEEITPTSVTQYDFTGELNADLTSGHVSSGFLGQGNLSLLDLANMDTHIVDGSTYVRFPGVNTVGTGTSRRALIDFSQAHTNKNLDNLADGGTYGRPLLSRLSGGKPTIDFSEAIHSNKNLDNISDGSTYGRLLATQMTSGAHKLTVANSGMTIADQRNLPVIAAAGLRYKFTGAISFSVTSSTAATITAGAGSMLLGGVTVSYNSMSVNVTGTSGSTVTYYLYVSANAYTAGAHTLIATTNSQTPYGADANAYIGACTLTYTSGGSGGGESGGGTCVCDGAFVHTDRGWIEAIDVRTGDRLLVLTDDREGLEWEYVESNVPALEFCYTVRGDVSGAEVTISDSTPITLRDGSIINAIDIDGHELPMESNGVMWWESCHIREAGVKRVCKIKCNQKTYSAGDIAGVGILTHNPKP